MTTQHTKHGQNERARHLMRRSGYKVGGAIPTPAPAPAQPVPTLTAALPKRATGGMVGGEAPSARLDKFARGGKTGKKKSHVTVNVINAAPPAATPPAAMPPMAMKPPMPVPPPGAMAGPPPGAGPGGPPLGMLKTGGKVVKMCAGAGSGEGRLEKKEKYGTKPLAK